MSDISNTLGAPAPQIVKPKIQVWVHVILRANRALKMKRVCAKPKQFLKLKCLTTLGKLWSQKVIQNGHGNLNFLYGFFSLFFFNAYCLVKLMEYCFDHQIFVILKLSRKYIMFIFLAVVVNQSSHLTSISAASLWKT